MKSFSYLIFSLLFFGLNNYGVAQTSYLPQRSFSPQFYSNNVNRFRSEDGSPGEDYWQNQADYQVTATFDTLTNQMSGRVLITYQNNSPNVLPFLWLELDQNIDRKDSRSSRMMDPDLKEKNKNGFQLQQVKVMENGKWVHPPFLINDTRMQINLNQPLMAKGGKLTIAIRYNYHLDSSAGGGRSGYLDTRNGRIYEFSYWYPRMCVYDDLRGWNTLPFLGDGEFYMDYGNIDYSITVPSGLLVAGSGKLLNPEQVLTPLETNRLLKARKSDQTVLIRNFQEPATLHQKGWTTWHFSMSDTRDVAWAMSRAFVWDAARINLPGGKKSLAMSVYPQESAGDSAWSRATEYVKNAIEIFSSHWFPYPYPAAISVGGRVGGMEFPGMTFDGWNAKGKNLWALLAHETGHNWFPMIVGSNERKNAWMDEGFNTFIDVYASKDFNHGEYAPKRDGEYAPKGGNPAEEIVPYLTHPSVPPIMTLADAFPPKYLHPIEYFKTAFGLVLLREVILGHQRFDNSFRKYIRDWAFKHPSPFDFFREMENNSGEDLSWFWRGWFIHNWPLDQAVTGVKYIQNDPSRGALITIENRLQMVFPVLVKVVEKNGRIHLDRLPVEIWESSPTWTFQIHSTSKIREVILDPFHQLPDINRANNVWKG
ncbi:MAG: M1 family metallopeptidase [Chitinophagaceae bacterium]